MSDTYNASENLVKTVMGMLISIPHISVQREENIVNLMKENKKFCIIKDNNVYLLDQNGEYKSISKDIFEEGDKFLQETTKSIWAATGKT